MQLVNEIFYHAVATVEYGLFRGLTSTNNIKADSANA